MTGCPFDQPAVLPSDGTPLDPSPTIAEWRDTAPAVPLVYQDGHVGLVVTRYDAARAVLADPRFSQVPHRMPLGRADAPPDTDTTTASVPTGGSEHAVDARPPAEHATPTGATLDDRARRSVDAANLLALDGAAHQRMRRAVTGRFSVKQVRARTDEVARRASRQLEHVRSLPGPVDVLAEFAQPIAAATHCSVIGVPDDLVSAFEAHFVRHVTEDGPSTTQAAFDFIRRVVDRRVGDPGEDVVSDLLASELSRTETEGLLFQLMSAGHDSVAYLIATATVALLRHPEQLALLRTDPSAIGPAVEEFLRAGAMFLTLFPRTATEDLTVDGVAVPAGTTVSVSPVGANRDPRRWTDPDTFDVGRDAFGHLGFGYGPHGCIGQQLARLEIREAVGQLAQGLPGLRLVKAEQDHPMPFANPVATYQAGAVLVDWDRGRGPVPTAI